MRKLTFLWAVLFVLVAGPAVAESSAPTAESNPILPVLVVVNDRGEVTKVDPAINLKSDQADMLRAVIDGMINAPAKDKDGKPIRSQFVMYFSMQPGEGKDAGYNITYLSSKPARSGPLHWVTYGRGNHKKYGLSSTRPGANVRGPETQPIDRTPMGPVVSGGPER